MAIFSFLIWSFRQLLREQWWDFQLQWRIANFSLQLSVFVQLCWSDVIRHTHTFMRVRSSFFFFIMRCPSLPHIILLYLEVHFVWYYYCHSSFLIFCMVPASPCFHVQPLCPSILKVGLLHTALSCLPFLPDSLCLSYERLIDLHLMYSLIQVGLRSDIFLLVFCSTCSLVFSFSFPSSFGVKSTF